MPDILALLLGLVLGAACLACVLYARRASADAARALDAAAQAAARAEVGVMSGSHALDKLAAIDHEVATLFDRANLRRS